MKTKSTERVARNWEWFTDAAPLVVAIGTIIAIIAMIATLIFIVPRYAEATPLEVASVANIDRACPTLRPLIKAAVGDRMLSRYEANQIEREGWRRKNARDEAIQTAPDRTLLGLNQKPILPVC